MANYAAISILFALSIFVLAIISVYIQVIIHIDNNLFLNSVNFFVVAVAIGLSVGFICWFIYWLFEEDY